MAHPRQTARRRRLGTLLILTLTAATGANSITRPAKPSASTIPTIHQLVSQTTQAHPTTITPPTIPRPPLPDPTLAIIPADLRIRDTASSEKADDAAPEITPGPPASSTILFMDASGEKFVQTTYYSCVTMGTYSHCGWHEPILDAGAGAGRGAGPGVVVKAAAGVVVGVFGGLWMAA